MRKALARFRQISEHVDPGSLHLVVTARVPPGAAPINSYLNKFVFIWNQKEKRPLFLRPLRVEGELIRPAEPDEQ